MFSSHQTPLATLYSVNDINDHCPYEELNLVTALVPSETACLANSPGSIKRTAVWISRLDKVAFLL